jgi:hypothetical protein
MKKMLEKRKKIRRTQQEKIRQKPTGTFPWTFPVGFCLIFLRFFYHFLNSEFKYLKK